MILYNPSLHKQHDVDMISHSVPEVENGPTTVVEANVSREAPHRTPSIFGLSDWTSDRNEGS
jgi:hypothetical protein